MKTRLLRVTLSLGMLLLAFRMAAQQPAAPPPFRNPALSVDQRVDDLLGRLTVDEKISQLMMSNAAIPRLNLPAYHWWNEALHGVARNGTATVFPQAIGLAATWNPALHQRIADTISTEARVKYQHALRQDGGATRIYEGLTLWSPNINIFRDPRWGRGQETYGEDPFLTAQMGLAFVRGLQGDDARYLKTVATVKHFAVHSGPEALRHRFDARVSARDLRETYLPAFEAAIREGRCASIMSAYNALDGVPAPASQFLLTTVLRNEWGFQGAVVGDVDTVGDIWKTNAHAYARDAAEASAMALKAGNDLCSGTTYNALPEALQRGLVTEADLDRALRRLLTLRFRLGMFDPAGQAGYTAVPEAENNSPAHEQLALEAARQSLVLLKNDGSLPWDARKLKNVAILGPVGDDNAALLGNYHGLPSHSVNLVQGLKARLEPLGVKVTYHAAVPLTTGSQQTVQPLPEGVLFTDTNKSAPGLKGELLAGKNPDSSVQAERIDPQVDFYWNEAQPIPGIPVRGAHVRWTGVIIPAETGDYVLGITFIGAARLFVDGVVVPGRQKSNEPGDLVTSGGSFKLVAGRPCKIRIEYDQTDGEVPGRIQFGWCPPGGMQEALAAAGAADHIILTLGNTPELEGEQMKVSAEGFDEGDRTTILLPKVQRDLLDAVARLGKPFIVILTGGSAISFDVSRPNAILEAWYYGQRGGDAVAEAICGDYNPAGRLPVTFYRDDRDLPPFASYAMANRTYRYFTGRPLYAFGHGLSYTKFAYKRVALSATSVQSDEAVTVSVTVKNAGKRAGDEVVQVYATAMNPPVPMPLRQLVGFERVAFKAGETKTVNIVVPAKLLRRWSETDNCYVVDPGVYRLAVGPSSDQPLLQAKLTLAREKH
jgi:beta-glucosidase